jgi:2-keto-4-pentenoate hydratase/2-oxohepta-3-ene-1,7-dioic acid hydratase in catechol pathway
MKSATCAIVATLFVLCACFASAAEIDRYVRYDDGHAASFGHVYGELIRQLDKAPWEGGKPTGTTVKRTEVKLLAPVEPSKVFAIGFNYDSHLGDRELPSEPPVFLKLPTAIIGPDEHIVFPQGAMNVHYEGEMVIVIGRTAKNIPREIAANYVFGVTAGNDVSDRDWAANDLQWFRAKASDTFGPVGPEIVTGLDYSDLLLQTRLNGKTVQKQRTRDLIHDVASIVSFISRYATLLPGDIIFTGTPGTTSQITRGDIVEVEIENVGILRNTVGSISVD